MTNILRRLLVTTAAVLTLWGPGVAHAAGSSAASSAGFCWEVWVTWPYVKVTVCTP